MSGDSVHLHHPLHYRAGLAWLGFRLKSLFDIGSFFQSPVIGSGLVRYHCVWHEVLYLRGPEGGLHGAGVFIVGGPKMRFRCSRKRTPLSLLKKECRFNSKHWNVCEMYACAACAVCLLRGVKLMMCQDWMWAVLDIFIVASSLWEVAVDIIQAVYEHLRVKMCERED